MPPFKADVRWLATGGLYLNGQLIHGDYQFPGATWHLSRYHRPTLSSVVINPYPAEDTDSRKGRHEREEVLQTLEAGDQELVYEFWLAAVTL